MTPASPTRAALTPNCSIARIVAAARICLGRDPDATIDDIAKEAGVGRMTLYGHFRTRAELVEAALVDAMRVGEETLSAVDLDGDARDALSRLLASSWSLVAESAALARGGAGRPPGRAAPRAARRPRPSGSRTSSAAVSDKACSAPTYRSHGWSVPSTTS